jgi:hypothetical protein
MRSLDDFPKLVLQVFSFALVALLLIYFTSCTQARVAIYYQAYDPLWDDPTINPIFEHEWQAKDYAHLNNRGREYNLDTSHSYIVRVINYRYEIRQINDWKDEVLHTTNSKEDGVKYVEQFLSAHEDLFMYDLKTGNLITTSTP